MACLFSAATTAEAAAGRAETDAARTSRSGDGAARQVRHDPGMVIPHQSDARWHVLFVRLPPPCASG